MNFSRRGRLVWRGVGCKVDDSMTLSLFWLLQTSTSAPLPRCVYVTICFHTISVSCANMRGIVAYTILLIHVSIYLHGSHILCLNWFTCFCFHEGTCWWILAIIISVSPKSTTLVWLSLYKTYIYICISTQLFTCTWTVHELRHMFISDEPWAAGGGHDYT